MRSLKRILLIGLAVLMIGSLTGCMSGQQQSLPELVLPTSSEAGSEASGTVKVDIKEISDAEFEDNLDGLCKFLEESYAAAGEKITMSYEVIDAIGGYKYSFVLNGSAVTVEVYEYDLSKLSEGASKALSSVEKNGLLPVLDEEKEAFISDNGKYVMLYTDGSKEEAAVQQKERVVAVFKSFKK